MAPRHKCYLWWCRKASSNDKVIFHRISKSRKRRWLLALGRNPDEHISDANRICSRHFSKHNYKNIKGKMVLKRNAQPTMNLQPRDLLDKPLTLGLVEEILKIERPALKKELHELQEVNLNVPPGFVKAEPGESSSESAEEAQEEEYTQNDDELVQLVLRESSSASAGDAKNNDLDTEQYPNDHMNEAEHNYSHSHSAEKDNSDNLAREITDLKKVIKRNLQTNTEMLRNQNEIHEQMLTFLESLDKREEEKLEIKRQKLEKQGELVQQIKVQNSLIAKLIQKFGNK